MGQPSKILLLAWMLGCALMTHAKDPASPRSAITILVFNDSDASRQLILDAENDAAQVFDKVGLAVDWINCGATPDPSSTAGCSREVGPNDLVVRIVAQARSLPGWVFGVSFLSDGTGAYADVFLDHVKRIHEEHKEATLARVVGHVVAHEAGHLLLGTTAHARTGIMQANWESDQLKEISMGRLLFSPQQGREIRTRVEARKPPSSSPVMAALRP